jgi:hypothetical protein
MHKMQNVLGKLPEAARNEVKQWLQAVRDAPTLEEGQAKAAQVIEMYERTYPAAMKSFADGVETCPPQAGEPGAPAGAADPSQIRAHHQWLGFQPPWRSAEPT